jgi:nitronate monooxygenase
MGNLSVTGMTSPSMPWQLQRSSLPVIAAPMFLVSGPELVIAQCKAGIVGSMPALNARSTLLLDESIERIQAELAEWDRNNPQAPAAPFAVNLIVHKSNARLDRDLEICAGRSVPMVISSLGAREEVNAAVHGWGGITLHDVIDDRFARKAIEKGADGLIAVAAGAGGHAGRWSPFALVQEIRCWFCGPLVLSGAIAHGRSILAAQAMGADFAYIGSPFIATEEAAAPAAYKQAILSCSAADIVYTDLISGVHANFLGPSLIAAGLEPDRLPQGIDDPGKLKSAENRRWRDIWSAGQGIGIVDRVQPAADFIAQLRRDYHAARQALAN